MRLCLNTHTLFSATDKQHSLQKQGCPLAVRDSQGKDQEVNSATNRPPSSAFSVHVETGSAVRQASLSHGTRVQPVCSASSQMSDEDCTQALVLPKEKNPHCKPPSVPSDTLPCVAEKGGSRSLLQLETERGLGSSRSEKILRLLDLYASELRQAQNSVIQRVPWGQPVSVGAKSVKAGRNKCLVWAEKSRALAVREQQLTISCSSPQKGLPMTHSKRSSEDNGLVGVDRDEKRLSLRVKKAKCVSSSSSMALLTEAGLSDPLTEEDEDFPLITGYDLPRGGSCSPGNCVSTGDSPLQNSGLEAVADSDSTDPTASPSRNQVVDSTLMDVGAPSHKLPLPAKRLKLCPASRTKDTSKRSNDSPVSSRRMSRLKCSLNSQDTHVPLTSQPLSDIRDKRGFEEECASSNVGRKKRRWISDEDSDEEYTTSNNPPSSRTQIPQTSTIKEEKKASVGVQEVKRNHSE